MLLSGVLFAIACSDSSGPGTSTIYGSYTLIALNGSPLPATLVDEGGFTVRFDSGSLTLNSGRTYSSSVNITASAQGQTFPVTGTCNGTFTQTGNNVSFVQTRAAGCEAGTHAGSWDGANTITVNDSVPAVYKK